MLANVQESVESENRRRQKNERSGLRRGETEQPLNVLLYVLPRRRKNESGGLWISEPELPAVVLLRRQKTKAAA